MYRKKTGGQGSFADVMRGMEMLKGEGVEFNVLCAVNDYNSRRPLEVYDFSVPPERVSYSSPR